MKKIHFKALDMQFTETVINDEGKASKVTVHRKVKYNPYYFPKK